MDKLPSEPKPPSSSNKGHQLLKADPVLAEDFQILNDKYRIIEKIGRGGMGQIFKAEQIPLEREIAIKVMRAPDNPEQEKRFFLEASLASRLTHPNTIRIFDYGQSSDGIVFIAMELLRCSTLAPALLIQPRLVS